MYNHFLFNDSKYTGVPSQTATMVERRNINPQFTHLTTWFVMQSYSITEYGSYYHDA